MSTARDIAQHKDSDLFSGKAVAVVSILGAGVLAIAGQLEDLFGLNPVLVVAVLCLLCSSPYAFRAFYASKERLPIRIGLALVALIAAWHTLFQTTRGSGTTYDQPSDPPSSYESAPTLSYATPGFLPLAVITPSLPPISFEVYGVTRQPFRPVYRLNNSTKKYEVLILYGGKHMWAESVQNTGSSRF